MKKEIKEELNDHAPLLSGMPRQPEGYKVPDGYFARMEADLWEQLNPATKAVTESVPQTAIFKKEIKEELNDHAPLLSGMTGQPEGYKVPDGYFARMETDLWEQIKPATKAVTESVPQPAIFKKEIKEELNDHAPLLSGMTGQPEGYKVPDGYFARMETDLWEQIKPATKTVTESAPQTSWFDGLIQQINWLLQPRMALQLASVALLVLAGFFFMNRSATTQTDALAEFELTADEASEYVLANLDEFDTESLLELGFGEGDFSAAENSLFNDTEIDELLDELQRENIDLETLEIYL